MDALGLLKTPDVELLHRADECLRRAGSALETPPSQMDDAVRLRLFLEAHSYLSEILRRRADKTAVQDRKTEHRRFVTELLLTILVVLLIGAEIWLSTYFGLRGLREGRQQAEILKQMNKNTEDTAAQIQRAADAMTATLQVLQADRADRLAQLAKKPKLQPFIGSVPVNRGPFNALHKPTYPIRDQTDTSVTLDFNLQNQGSASATKVTLRLIVRAADVSLASNVRFMRPDEPPDVPYKTFITQIDVLRPTVNLPMTLTFSFPKGRAAFDVILEADADQIESATPLGTITIAPRTPTN